MLEVLNIIVKYIKSSGTIGAVIGCGLILVESILPVLPLVVFITINFLVFGNLIGFIISWIFTVLGCVMSYMIFKYGFGNKFERLTEDKVLLKKYNDLFKSASLLTLTLIIAMPFTPAFAVNIAAGLTKVDFKKYLVAIIIGKIALVYFWGFVGSSVVESIKNPIILIKIIVIMLITYLITFAVNKILKIQ